MLVGCSVQRTPLPNGIYQPTNGPERVIVQGQKIRFIVQLDTKRTNLFDQTYENHSVWPNGKIQPFPMREADAILGIGRFYWLWDGTNINRTNRMNPINPITGDKVVFFRQTQ